VATRTGAWGGSGSRGTGQAKSCRVWGAAMVLNPNHAMVHVSTSPDSARLSSGDNKQEGEGAISLSLTDSWPELLQLRAPAFSTSRWRCKTVVPGGLDQAQGSSISRRR